MHSCMYTYDIHKVSFVFFSLKATSKNMGWEWVIYTSLHCALRVYYVHMKTVGDDIWITTFSTLGIMCVITLAWWSPFYCIVHICYTGSWSPSTSGCCKCEVNLYYPTGCHPMGCHATSWGTGRTLCQQRTKESQQLGKCTALWLLSTSHVHVVVGRLRVISELLQKQIALVSSFHM